MSKVCLVWGCILLVWPAFVGFTSAEEDELPEYAISVLSEWLEQSTEVVELAVFREEWLAPTEKLPKGILHRYGRITRVHRGTVEVGEKIKLTYLIEYERDSWRKEAKLRPDRVSLVDAELMMALFNRESAELVDGYWDLENSISRFELGSEFHRAFLQLEQQGFLSEGAQDLQAREGAFECARLFLKQGTLNVIRGFPQEQEMKRVAPFLHSSLLLSLGKADEVLERFQLLKAEKPLYSDGDFLIGGIHEAYQKVVFEGDFLQMEEGQAVVNAVLVYQQGEEEFRQHLQVFLKQEGGVWRIFDLESEQGGVLSVRVKGVQDFRPRL